MFAFGRRRKRRSRPNRTKASDGDFAKVPLSDAITVQMVTAAYKLAAFLSTVPFEVIKGSGLRVQLFRSKYKQIWWYCTNAILYSYGIFQTVSFALVLLEQGLTTESALHIIYIVIYSVGIIFYVPLLCDGSACVFAVNSIDSLMRTSEGEEWAKAKWYSSLFGAVAITYYGMIVGCVYLVTWGIFLWTPTHSRYLFSTLPTEFQDKWLLIFLGGVLESTMYLWTGLTTFHGLCYWVMVTFQKIFWLDEMRTEMESCGRDAERWRRILGFYRALKCLNISHNDFSRWFLIAYYVDMVLVAVLYLYCTLMAYHLLPLALYLIFPFVAGFTLLLIVSFTPYTAKWEQKSADFIAIALVKLGVLRRTGKEFEALYKEARSFQLIKSEMGFFDTTTVDTPRELIGQVIDQLLLLLSL